jgi:hypothetical protein
MGTPGGGGQSTRAMYPMPPPHNGVVTTQTLPRHSSLPRLSQRASSWRFAAGAFDHVVTASNRRSYGPNMVLSGD